MARPVTRVLFDVRSKHPPKPLEGGEVWTEKHWFFNGEYWGQMRRYDQIAFVDGYCVMLSDVPLLTPDEIFQASERVRSPNFAMVRCRAEQVFEVGCKA